MTYAPAAPRFEITRVMSRMSGVISRNFAVLAALSLVLSGLPSLLIGLAGLVKSPFLVVSPAGALSLLPLFNLLISALLQAALIHATVTDLNGAKASLNDCLTTAIRNVLPLIGISIATTVATIFGLIFFIVPGVILALAFCVAAPVRVIEGLGVFKAMGRSAELTRHHRGALLMLFILFGIGMIVLTAAAAPLLAIGGLVSGGASGVIGALLIRPVIQAGSALIGAAGVASIYFELRTIKEGVGVEAMAAAFD